MAEMGLAGKVAVVTGAGSRGDGIGNGRAAAILLAREGAHVALLDAMPDWAEVTRAMIAAEGGSAMVVSADVADEASCAAAVAAAVARWGRVDVLVNNVGIAGPSGSAVGGEAYPTKEHSLAGDIGRTWTPRSPLSEPTGSWVGRSSLGLAGPRVVGVARTAILQTPRASPHDWTRPNPRW